MAATKSKRRGKLAIHNALMKYEDVQAAFVKELPASIGKVLELRNSDNPRVALEASKECINRAVGPVQNKSVVELTGANGGPVQNSFTVTFVRPGEATE